MRWAIGFALALAIGATAQAASFRWTTGYAQGAVVAMIRNPQRASFSIECPTGGIPVMLIEARNLKPAANEAVDVQIVVDGKSHPFQFDEIVFKAQDAASITSLAALIDALAKSRSNSFVLQFPKLGFSETFALAGARKALQSSSEDFLESCNGKDEQ